MESSIPHPAPPRAAPTTPLRTRVLTKLFQTVLTLLSLGALALSYINWDSRKLQREIAHRIQIDEHGKGFRELASPVLADHLNFCAIPSLKDCAGGTGSADRDAQTQARIENLSKRLGTICDPLKKTARDSVPFQERLVAWAEDLRAKLPSEVIQTIPESAQPQATILAATTALLPELQELLEASDRPSAQWTPALRVRKFKSPVFFSTNSAFGVSIKWANLLGMLARIHVANGDAEAALRCIKAMVRLVEADFDEPLRISSLVGTSVLAVAISTIHHTISDSRTSDTQIKAILTELEGINTVKRFAITSRCESALGLELIDSLADPNVRQGVKTAMTIYPTYDGESIAPSALLFSFSGALIKNLSLRALKALIETEAPLVNEDISGNIRRIREVTAHPRSILTRLQERILPTGPALEISQTIGTAEAKLRLCRLACAVEIHRRSQNLTPTSLSDLPPAVVKENSDPLSSKPMQYAVKVGASGEASYRIWSVGLDLIDDQGEIEQTKFRTPANTRSGDIVWNSIPPKN